MNHNQLTRRYSRDGVANLVDRSHDVVESETHGLDSYDSYIEPLRVLLMAKIRVAAQEHVEIRLRRTEKLTVLQTAPPLLLSRADDALRQLVTEFPRKVGVE
ncbi:MAG: hypothetical protein WB973_14845 [Thermoanaerobaculia bacterium]